MLRLSDTVHAVELKSLSDSVRRSIRNNTHSRHEIMDDDKDENHIDPADALMARGDFLRQLREMERADEAARQEKPSADEDDLVDNGSTGATHDDTSSVAEYIVDYSSFLRHQSFYDDLKHVDYKFIDYGTIASPSPSQSETKESLTLVVEQDKRLGKGGLCWDAAFCLGEHLIDIHQTWNDLREKNVHDLSSLTVVELGCGTGLAGLLLAKAVPDLCVSLTDLPPLMPLLNRNIQRNFQSSHIISQKSGPSNALNDGKDDYSEILSPLTKTKGSLSRVQSFVLDWDDIVTGKIYNQFENPADLQFDIVIGADVVATLYDPQALAKTIHRVARNEKSLIYISFKERLSAIHREFEQAMESLFDHVEILPASLIRSRNKNPGVGIIVARGRKLS